METCYEEYWYQMSTKYGFDFSKNCKDVQIKFMNQLFEMEMEKSDEYKFLSTSEAVKVWDIVDYQIYCSDENHGAEETRDQASYILTYTFRYEIIACDSDRMNFWGEVVSLTCDLIAKWYCFKFRGCIVEDDIEETKETKEPIKEE